jgi:hypothetical protein
VIGFQEFPKIARLSRQCVITEKIDGTNASIYVPEIPDEAGELPFLVGSRTRWITPEADNYGFARWAYEHAEPLLGLGAGHHFGEWWGSGVQRGYGLPKGEKRFSLFNVARWADDRDREKFPQDRPACCHVVPVLYRGPFTTVAVEETLAVLRIAGSAAAPGFDKPEGVVVYHEAARTLFKKTLEKDEQPKVVAA